MKLILEDHGKVVTFELSGDEPAVVGRGVDNTVPIREPQASRKHCQIVLGPEGARAEDLGSKNGTFLNGKRLREPALLKPGDWLGIGETRVWFEERKEAAAAAAKPPAPKPAAARPEAETDTPDPEGGAPDLPAGQIYRGLDAEGPSDLPAGQIYGGGGRYTLEVVEGEGKGRKIPISALPFKIGRTKKNALIIHDTNASGEHCEIVARQDGGLALVDLGSTNGTKVNGAKVKRAALTDASRIEIGASLFVFHDAEKPAVVPPEQHPKPRKMPTPQPPAKSAVATGPQASGLELQGAETGASAPAARASGRAAAQAPPAPAPAAARVGPSPQPGARLPEPESGVPAVSVVPSGDVLSAAAEGLGESASFRAVETGGRPWGAIAAGVIAALVLAAAGLFAATALRAGREQAADPDPAPRGNRVANWSFEDDAGAAAAPPKWRVDGGTIALDAAEPAGGARSLRVTPREGLAEVASAATLPTSGRDISVRAMVRGGPAALGLLFESSQAPGFRWLATSDLVASEGWREVRAAFHPPPGADLARVVLLASGAAGFDRVAAAEREALTGRAGSQRVDAGAGIDAWVDERGIFELRRDGWPVFDRGGLVLVGDGPLAALARQEAAASIAESAAKPAPKKGALKPKSSGAREEPPGVLGSLVRPDGTRQRFLGHVLPVEGGLLVRYRLSEPAPGAAPAITLYMEQSGRAGRFEVTAAATRQTSGAETPFDQAGVSEVAFGAGNEGVSLRLDPPRRVRSVPLGRGLLLTVLGEPGAKEVALVFGRGSLREKDVASSLFQEAEAEKKAGRLEEARRLFAQIARDFAHDAAARERAREAERGVQVRAQTALDEAAAIEGDIAAFGAAELLETAAARCRFVIDAFQGSPSAVRAKEALGRVGELRAKLLADAHADRARELFALGRRHLEARRYRLARLYLRLVARDFAELRDLAGEAERDAELCETQMKERS